LRRRSQPTSRINLHREAAWPPDPSRRSLSRSELWLKEADRAGELEVKRTELAAQMDALTKDEQWKARVDTIMDDLGVVLMGTEPALARRMGDQMQGLVAELKSAREESESARRWAAV
jgi:hypothetical protein